MRETGRSGVAAYLVKCVKAVGGEYRKVVFTAHNGAPDYLVWIPRWKTGCFIETKRPKKGAEGHQLREHERLRIMGFKVHVASSKEAVNVLIYGV